MAKDNKSKEKLDINLDGKGLNDLAQNIDLEKDSTEEFAPELIDNRNYDKYDYYEFDRKKGSIKNYIIMFALYSIVISLVILLIIGFKYKKPSTTENNSGEINETQNQL